MDRLGGSGWIRMKLLYDLFDQLYEVWEFGYSPNWSPIRLFFRSRYSDFSTLFSILGYIFQSDRRPVFKILNYRSSLFMLRIIKIFFIFGILVYSQSNSKHTVHREFYYRFHQVQLHASQIEKWYRVNIVWHRLKIYIVESAEDIHVLSYRSVVLWVLLLVIHILSGIILAPVFPMFIFPLSKFWERNFCKVDGM